MVVMFLLTFTVFAAHFDVGAGLTYDSFSFVVEDTSEEETPEAKMPHDALGVNIAGTYWFTDTLGVEANLDFVKGDVFNMSSGPFPIKISSQLIGPSVAIKYMVLKSPLFVNVKAGAGYYFYNLIGEATSDISDPDTGTTYTETTKITIEGNGFGMLVGAEMMDPITDNLAIKANVGYKLFTNIKNLEDQDGDEEYVATISMNGLKLGFGVAYSF